MRVVLRRRAEQDIERNFALYLEQADSKTATAFVNAVDAGLRHIAKFPESGSSRYGALFDTPDLRFWLLKKFPYALFYVVHKKHLDIIRLLHQHSEIPALLGTDVPDWDM